MSEVSTAESTTEVMVETETKQTQTAASPTAVSEVCGLDLGDKYSYLYVVDSENGDEVEQGRVQTTEPRLRAHFSGRDPMLIAIESGTHSPWVSRVLGDLGHEVLVANPRSLGFIYKNMRKNDAIDAERLARVARMDKKLLHPIEHRGEQAHADLGIIRSRDVLVRNRTQLVNHLRGSVKSAGTRFPKCSTPSIGPDMIEHVPEPLRPSLFGVLEQIQQLTEQIKTYDRRIEQLADTRYPETKILRQIKGVGPLTALAFVLIIETPWRFKNNRSVGAYAGLVPKQDESGDRDSQLRITKAGNSLLRKLLINAAHYITGPFGVDSDLRRHGEKIAERGGKNAKKRAIVAVARKLSVVLLSLWKSGETYEPLRNSQAA